MSGADLLEVARLLDEAALPKASNSIPDATAHDPTEEEDADAGTDESPGSSSSDDEEDGLSEGTGEVSERTNEPKASLTALNSSMSRMAIDTGLPFATVSRSTAFAFSMKARRMSAPVSSSILASCSILRAS